MTVFLAFTKLNLGSTHALIHHCGFGPLQGRGGPAHHLPQDQTPAWVGDPAKGRTEEHA